MSASCEDQGGKTIVYNNRMVAENLRKQVQELKKRLEAVKDILKLPKRESADETPDMVLGFEEQFYLKQILEDKE